MSFAREQIMARLEVFTRALRRAADQPSDAEAIHALRVASRRFGQCLRTFEPILEAKAAKKIGARMRKLMDRCGEARNYDITLLLLHEAGIGDRSKLAGQIRARRREAEAKLVEHLIRWRHRNIVKSWPGRLFDGSDEDFTPDLSTLTAELFERGRGAAAAESSYEEMHRFRLAAKRYRYTVEIFKPLHNAAAVDSVLSCMRELQDKLGAMNDCVTALDLVQGHGRATRAILQFLQVRERAFRTHWKRHFGKRRLNEWTSIFSATGKQNPAGPALRKQPARSLRAAAKTSAA